MTQYGSSVSVVIPCFNRQNHITDALESALAQVSVDEVIVVDDGSTDDSWEKICSFGSKIKAIRVQNGGPSRARNIGVRNSSGDYIKFLDSDDLLIGNSVETQIRQLKNLPYRSIPIGKLTSNLTVETLTESKTCEITPYQMGLESIQVSRPLIPRIAFDEVGGFRYSTAHEDYELFVRMAAVGWRFFEFDSSVVEFRDVDVNRLSLKLNPERFNEMLNVFQRLERDLFGDMPALSNQLQLGVAAAAWSIGRRCARLGHKITAKEFFELAYRLGGKSARNGSIPVKFLYLFLNPTMAESLISLLKKLVVK